MAPLPCEMCWWSHSAEKVPEDPCSQDIYLHLGGVTDNTQLSKYKISDWQNPPQNKEESGTTETLALRRMRGERTSQEVHGVACSPHMGSISWFMSLRVANGIYLSLLQTRLTP